MLHPIYFYGKGTDMALLNVDGIILAPMWLYQSSISPKELWTKVNVKWEKVIHTHTGYGTLQRAYGGVETLYTRNRNGLWQIDRMIKWHLDNETAVKHNPAKAKDPSLYKHSRHSSARTAAAYVARLLQVGATDDKGNYISGEDEHSGVLFAWDAGAVLKYFLKLDRRFQKMKGANGMGTSSQRPAHERWGINQGTHLSHHTGAFDGGAFHSVAEEQ
jgi:hypothetical protein